MDFLWFYDSVRRCDFCKDCVLIMCVCALHFMLEVLSRLWANVLCTCSIRLWLRKRNRANWKQIETDWFKLFEIDFAILLEGRCSRPGRCISNFPSMWLLQPTRRAVLCRCRACTRLGRDLPGARPPWVLWLAPRWRHLSGRWEVNRKPLSICMRTMEEATSTCCAKGPIFCSAKRISVNPFAAQLGSRWMRIWSVSATVSVHGSKLITIHDNHTIRWFALINQVWNRLGI